MFDHLSRYHDLEITTTTLPGGRTAAYVRRRFLPRGSHLPLLSEVAVVQGDRIDSLAHRALGDPLAWWRICDANDAMDPAELTASPGRRLRIPLPEA